MTNSAVHSWDALLELGDNFIGLFFYVQDLNVEDLNLNVQWQMLRRWWNFLKYIYTGIDEIRPTRSPSIPLGGDLLLWQRSSVLPRHLQWSAPEWQTYQFSPPPPPPPPPPPLPSSSFIIIIIIIVVVVVVVTTNTTSTLSGGGRFDFDVV